jgi:hypothetical protein
VTGQETPEAGAFEVRIAWRRDNAEIEADAIAMWKRSGILPADVSPEARAKELAAALYADGKLAAVATAVIEHIGFLRHRFFVLRSMTNPDLRLRGAQNAITLPVKRTLEQWAIDHPEEKAAGVIGFVEPGAWGEFNRLPIWPIWPLTLVAYTHDGKQVRAAWFDHFRLD